MVEEVDFPVEFSAPRQGFRRTFDSIEALDQFFRTEQDFYNHLSINGQNIIVGDRHIADLNLSGPASEQFASIRKRLTERQDLAGAEQFFALANNLELFIGQGPIGQMIADLHKQDRKDAFVLLAAVYSRAWGRLQNRSQSDFVDALRVLVVGHPGFIALEDLNGARAANQEAAHSREASRRTASEIELFESKHRKLFDELENIYRNKLTIDEPALRWHKIARQKTIIWIAWLVGFGAMVLAPIIAAIIFWPQVTEAVAKTAAPNGGFSLSGVAVITVPALLYAWLLKNISRVFIQNLNLADDADHRRSLALTYLGLMANEKHGLLDTDRAIILNALFRPIPPQTLDEGPPAGVLELIKGR